MFHVLFSLNLTQFHPRTISPFLCDKAQTQRSGLFSREDLHEVSRARRPPSSFSGGSPYPEYWTLEDDIVARGCGASSIYTFESQFAQQSELEAASADVDFLKSLNLKDLLPGGSMDVHMLRLLVSPAEGNVYDADSMPTPRKLVADLKALDFRSNISDMDDDVGPLPVLRAGYNLDQIHEDAEEDGIFETSYELKFAMKGFDETRGESYEDWCWNRDNTFQNLAQLAALRQYAVNQRVFFVVIRTHRTWMSSTKSSSYMAVLMALGVSPTTGNLVGTFALQGSKDY